MVERRAEVVGRMKMLEDAAAPLISFLQNPALVQELKSDKQSNLLMLNERYQVYTKSLFSLHFSFYNCIRFYMLCFYIL